MKLCCEYCKHCDEDYETICVFCRVDGGKVDFSKFELTDELAELERKAQMYDELLASMLPTVEQLKERERLAKIGKMFEWALSNDMVFNKFQSIQHLERIYEKHNENVKELIKTFKLTICESEEKEV